MQVPHTPCSHEVITSTPAAASACTTLWSFGTTTTRPELASWTSKLPSLVDAVGAAEKNS